MTNLDTGEQKKRVSQFFGESKDWQGDLYKPKDQYFARVIVRRKEYAVQMIDALQDLKSGKALDVGCGSGVYLTELMKRGFETYGMDLSEEMIRVCSNLPPEHGKRPHLANGDVEVLPFKDSRFDLVLCIGVMGYLLSDERAIASLKRIIKPGRYLLLNLTNMYSLSDFDFVYRKRIRDFFRGSAPAEATTPQSEYSFPSDWMLKNRKYNFKSYNLWKYERILSDAGFRRIDAMSYGFEFRLLRKIKIIPESLLFSLELLLEKIIRNVRIPYFSYSGWVYTGIFQRVE